MAETVAFSSPADEKLALELVAKRTQALKDRIGELEQVLQQTGMHFHIAHSGSAFLTVPPFSECSHPVCDAARKVMEPSKERGKG